MKKFAVIILLMMLLTVSCGTEKTEVSEKAGDETDIEVSEAILEEAIKYELAEAQYDEGETPDYILVMEELSSYSVESYETESTVAQAKVKVSSADLYSAVKSIEDQVFDDESEIDKAVSEALKKSELASETIELTFEYHNDKWNVILSDEFVDAYYGGLLELRQEYYEEMDQ